MDSKQILTANFDDILFDGRNKKYGAYVLRKNYNRRMGIAVLVGIGVVVIFLVSAMVINREKGPNEKLVLTELELGEPPPMDENEPPPPPPPAEPPPPPVKAQVQFTPPIIKKDNEIEKTEVPDNKQIEEAVISNQNVEGSKSNEAIVENVTFKQSEEVKKVELPKEDNKIYEIVEQEAQYPGGESALQNFVSSNFVYTTIARENGIEGTLIVRFVVEKDGSVSGVKVARGLGYGLDEEAVRVISKLKPFTPAKQNGTAVRVYYSYPLRLRLD